MALYLVSKFPRVSDNVASLPKKQKLCPYNRAWSDVIQYLTAWWHFPLSELTFSHSATQMQNVLQVFVYITLWQGLLSAFGLHLLAFNQVLTL